MKEPINNGPIGEVVIKAIPMPGDTNPNGDIFGGWIMSQMDLGGAVVAKRASNSRVATVAVESMSFHCPVKVGDVVSCYAQLKRIGRTSMTVEIAVWVHRTLDEKDLCVTQGTFTYVAIDDSGMPIPVQREDNPRPAAS